MKNANSVRKQFLIGSESPKFEESGTNKMNPAQAFPNSDEDEFKQVVALKKSTKSTWRLSKSGVEIPMQLQPRTSKANAT